MTPSLTGWSRECFCEWKEFITLGAPSIVLSLSEWICFELGIISLGLYYCVNLVIYENC